MMDISIHALLAESDKSCQYILCRISVYFYPRSPCGERHAIIGCNPDIEGISIHALLAESDSARVNSMLTLIHFYPRSPCGERRHSADCNCRNEYFYPRSPCGERPPWGCSALLNTHFYPRSPCGERPDEIPYQRQIYQFLSTLSLRRATF